MDGVNALFCGGREGESYMYMYETDHVHVYENMHV